MNEALRKAMVAAELRQLDIAAQLSVDPKTVERWLAGRVPHARSREAIARLVGAEAEELWPSASEPRGRGRLSEEVRSVYPHRWAVPRGTWVRFFEQAESEICILVYSGLFLVEDAGIVRLLADKARAGVTVRILFGDPDCAEVVQRGIDERIGDSTSARIRNALALLRPLVGVEGIELRLHRTILYNSIFRADDEILVNPHIYSLPASNAPVLHLRGSHKAAMFTTYVESFESVWAAACSA